MFLISSASLVPTSQGLSFPGVWPLSLHLSGFQAQASGAILLPSGAAVVQSLFLVVSASLLYARLHRLPLAVFVFPWVWLGLEKPMPFFRISALGMGEPMLGVLRPFKLLLSERLGRKHVSDAATHSADF